MLRGDIRGTNEQYWSFCSLQNVDGDAAGEKMRKA